MNPFAMTVSSVRDLVAGCIILWSGSVVNIPNGFVLCDGTNGTPDLRNRFIVGAGAAYDPDDSGGADSQVHTFQTNPPAIGFSPLGDPDVDAIEVNRRLVLGPVLGTTDSSDNKPLYYALALIMKV